MLELARRRLGDRELVVVATEVTDGDMRPDGAHADAPPRAPGARWVMVDEEHGVGVFDADAPPHSACLPVGDVIVTSRCDTPIAIWAGDCAPLILGGQSGVLVGVHAGWKGLAAGVVDVAIAAMAERGDGPCVAVLGPCIHVECYEFGDTERELVAAGVGAESARITGTTTAGTRGLDVPAAVGVALSRHGVVLDVVGPCTACDTRWFSHRARGDLERHAVVAWTERVGT